MSNEREVEALASRLAYLDDLEHESVTGAEDNYSALCHDFLRALRAAHQQPAPLPDFVSRQQSLGPEISEVLERHRSELYEQQPAREPVHQHDWYKDGDVLRCYDCTEVQRPTENDDGR